MLNSNHIDNKNFLKYKFLNSLFLGLSLGSVFTVYATLEPSIFSLGGIFLAIFMMYVAKMYDKILNYEYFFKISLLVELLVLVIIFSFLIFSYNYTIALLVYLGYQVTFIFGSYLIRIETMILKKKKLIQFVDITKQKGYLVGMALSYIYYKVLEHVFLINDNQAQVYNIHFLLVLVQVTIIYFLIKSFKQKNF